VKFVLDMNFDPEWVERLSAVGLEAVHWSTVGRIDAEDREIIEWAAANGYAVVTHDLDFGRIVSLARSRRPSVVTVRVRSTNPKYAERDLVWALGHFRFMIEGGALISIDEDRRRVRMLPIDGLPEG
jgi:predicted nuclease of predicted toxin-antitoxin system